MRILSISFHRAIEHYWTKMFPEHQFFFLEDGDMDLRPRNPNSTLVSRVPRKIDLAVANTSEQWQRLKKYAFPVLYWEHHLPYEPKPKRFSPPVVVYLSQEAKKLWGIGDYQYVARHPIDLDEFSGWQGDYRRVLMVASMPMEWWGEKKGASLLKKMVDMGVPYKLVGKDNEQDWPLCEPEFVTDPARMREIYRQYRVYGCTSPQIERSPLEALATGMPLITRKHEFNTLVEELSPVATFCESDEEFSWTLLQWVRTHPVRNQQFSRQRELIAAYFSPQAVKQVWEEAFAKCLQATPG